jgi:predicted nuclease with TOPRIM domain
MRCKGCEELLEEIEVMQKTLRRLLDERSRLSREIGQKDAEVYRLKRLIKMYGLR